MSVSLADLVYDKNRVVNILVTILSVVSIQYITIFCRTTQHIAGKSRKELYEDIIYSGKWF